MNLIQESDSAKHLLAYGTRALRTAAFIYTTRDPIMTMLSIGVEKLLKLGLGLLHVEDNRVWLPARVLKNDYRHDLIRMESLLREAIRKKLDRATCRYVVDQKLAAVDGGISDPGTTTPSWSHCMVDAGQNSHAGSLTASFYYKNRVSYASGFNVAVTP